MAEELDLDEFLRVLPFMENGELLAMGAAYRQTERDALEAARAEASAVARRRGLDDRIREVQTSIVQWASSSGSASQLMTFENVSASSSMLGDVRRDNLPPLLDAAMALVLGDQLDATSREILLAPLAGALEP